MTSDYRLAFILGSPRSGTSWLTKLLADHPSIAVPAETHLFSMYLGPLWTTWQAQQQALREGERAQEVGRLPRGRIIGLPTVVDEWVIDELARTLLTRVCESVLSAKPGATVVLEKTPGHSFETPLIERVAGSETKYVHLVRDGRDVAASMLRVKPTWGSEWAPSSAADAGQTWREHVLAARGVSTLPGRYLEVRYEDMVEDYQHVLDHVFDFLEVERLSIASDADGVLVPTSRLFADGVPEPPDFRSEARGQSLADALEVERVAGDLLDDLGYPKLSSSTVVFRARVVGRVRRLLASVAGASLSTLAGRLRRD